MASRYYDIDINDFEPRQAPKRSVFTPSNAFLPTVPEVSVMFQDWSINTSEAHPLVHPQQLNKDERALTSSTSPGQRHENGPLFPVIDAKHEKPQDGRRNNTMFREISNKHCSDYSVQRPENSLPMLFNNPKHVGLDRSEDRRCNNFFQEVSTQTEVDRTPLSFLSEEWKSCMNAIHLCVSELNLKVDRMCKFIQFTNQAVQSTNGSLDKFSSDIVNMSLKITELEYQFFCLTKDSRNTSPPPAGCLLSPYNNDAGDNNDWTRYNEAAAEVANNCCPGECDRQTRESVIPCEDQVEVKNIFMQHQQMKQQMEQAAMQSSNTVPGSFMVNHPGRHTDEELNALAVAAGGTTADICLNNMSFSTVDYLERHGIICNANDQSRSQRFATVRNKRELPCAAEKQPRVCGGVGYRCCEHHIEEEADNARTSSRLLDITAIKRLPKLT